MRIRKIRVKVFTPGNHASREVIIHGAPHVYLNPPLIQAKVDQLKKEIEDILPTEEFKLVKLSSRQWNLVWVKSKLRPGDMSDPVVATWKPQ